MRARCTNQWLALAFQKNHDSVSCRRLSSFRVSEKCAADNKVSNETKMAAAGAFIIEHRPREVAREPGSGRSKGVEDPLDIFLG